MHVYCYSSTVRIINMLLRYITIFLLFQRLSHRNVNTVLGTRFMVDRVYLLLPYARMSLGDLLLYRLSISRRNAVCILFQVLCGLSHCHSNGVLHGNLTPMHIVVEPQVINEYIFMHAGALTTKDLDTYLSGATFKLTDFSRCRKLLFPPMRSKSHHSSTKVLSALHCTQFLYYYISHCAYIQQDELLFTLQYLPPEVLMGEEQCESSADVWHAGCVFAEVLTGTPVFDGRNGIDQLFRIFSKLGTPDRKSWPEFEQLPYYSDGLFPQWERVVPRGLYTFFPTATDADLEVLYQLLQLDPKKRLSAMEATVFLSKHQIHHSSCCCSDSSSSSYSDIKPFVVEHLALQPMLSTSHEVRVRVFLTSIVQLLPPEESLDRYTQRSNLKIQQLYAMKPVETKKINQLMEIEPYDMVEGLFRSSFHVNRRVRNTRSMEEVESIRTKLRSNVGYQRLVNQLIEMYNVRLQEIVGLRTLFFAVSLLTHCMDMFILSQEDDKDDDEGLDLFAPEIFVYLEMLVLACLLVATKCEEIDIEVDHEEEDHCKATVGPRSIALIRGRFKELEEAHIVTTIDSSDDDLLVMEFNILNSTQFDLDHPTVLDFVRPLLQECSMLAPIDYVVNARGSELSLLEFVAHFFGMCTLVSTDARYLKYLLYTQAASIIYYSYAVIIAAKKSLHLAYNGIPDMLSQHYETLLVTVVSALKCWLTAIDVHADLSIVECLLELRDDHWNRDLRHLYRPAYSHLPELQLLDAHQLERPCLDRVINDIIFMQ